LIELLKKAGLNSSKWNLMKNEVLCEFDDNYVKKESGFDN
jgi:hypothetical protein